MKKTSKARTPAKCESAISNGAIKCALAPGHAGEHSDKPKTAKGQRVTWSLLKSGESWMVTSYSAGKKLGGWVEDVTPDTRPQHQPCDCGGEDGTAEQHDLCAPVICMVANHDCCCCRSGKWRYHLIGAEGCETQGRPAMLVEADAAASEQDDSFEDEVRSDADRDLARKMREDREAHIRELEKPSFDDVWSALEADGKCDVLEGTQYARIRDEWIAAACPEPAAFILDRANDPPPSTRETSLTDECPKCGKEYGEHDGKKCPKPEKKPIAKQAADKPPIVTSDGRVTKIGNHVVHPAAALFPMIADDARAAFLEDVRANGQRKRIVQIDVGGSWQILDGRNRLSACLELGIQPRFRIFGDEPGDGSDPIAFVISENIQRRHLDETQRAFVGAELVPMYEAQAKQRMLSGRNPSPNSGEGGKATELAARAVNVGKTSIEAAIKVKRDAAPEVLAASKGGRLKVSAAAELATLPKAKQREIVEKVGGGEIRSGKVRSLVRQEGKRDVVRKINEGRVLPPPLGPFGVIYADYPWKFENSDQHEGSRGHLPYPPMSLDEIEAHARQMRSRAAENCILALWTTNWHIIEQMPQVLRAYGATHRTVITWPKPKAGVGSWPRGQTEHLVIASYGEPTHTLNEITTLLESYAQREHSRKPEEVALLLAKHCAGPFLELFGREQRDGWSVWGAEAQKFDAEAA